MNEQQYRQIDTALALVGSALTVVLALRLLVGPDKVRLAKMYAYRSVARSAKHGADVLTTVAAQADTAYHRLTNVTV